MKGILTVHCGDTQVRHHKPPMSQLCYKNAAKVVFLVMFFIKTAFFLLNCLRSTFRLTVPFLWKSSEIHATDT